VIADQTGLDIRTAREIGKAFDRTYPGVVQYMRKLERSALADGYVTTGTGRRLPVDSDRAYSAMNYMIQSTSRDITCQALIDLDKAGFTPYQRLVIHDEFLLSFPESKAERGAKKVARIARTGLKGVNIDTDHEVYGRSWGDGYRRAA
jgi:DNA polymerase-1